MNADWLNTKPETTSEKLRRWISTGLIILIFGYGIVSIVRDAVSYC